MEGYLKEVGVVLLLGGIVSLTAAGAATSGSFEQLAGIAVGLGMLVGGMGSMMWDVQMRKRSDLESSDTGFWYRVVGVFVALVSTGLPYTRIPLPSSPGAAVEGERTPESFVDIAYTLAMTGNPEIELAMLFFGAVVVLGAFIGIFHHLGGYVILFGSIGFAFILIQLLQVGFGTLLFVEFQPGVWVAIFGALLIVTSPMLKLGRSSAGEPATSP